jgi:hypothetical protein
VILDEGVPSLGLRRQRTSVKTNVSLQLAVVKIWRRFSPTAATS